MVAFILKFTLSVSLCLNDENKQISLNTKWEKYNYDRENEKHDLKLAVINTLNKQVTGRLDKTILDQIMV